MTVLRAASTDEALPVFGSTLQYPRRQKQWRTAQRPRARAQLLFSFLQSRAPLGAHSRNGYAAFPAELPVPALHGKVLRVHRANLGDSGDRRFLRTHLASPVRVRGAFPPAETPPSAYYGDDQRV